MNAQTPCPACGSTQSSHAFSAPDCFMRAVAGEFSYSRCLGCGSVFADPPPDDATLSAAYSKDYGPHSEARGVVARLAAPLLHREARRVTESVGPGARMLPIVEVGCGAGLFLERLQHVGWAGPITGVEMAPDVARRTAERTGFDIRVGTAETGELPHGPYGVIVLRHVIEHVRDPHMVIERLLGHLHPEGVLYISTPDARALAAKVFRRRWPGYDVPRHLCVFTSGALRDVVGQAGGTVQREWWPFTPEMWNGSVYLALDHGRGLSWTGRFTSLLNPLVTVPAVIGSAIEVLTRRSTVHCLIAGPAQPPVERSSSPA